MNRKIVSFLCFFLPILIMGLVYAFRGVYPFGDSSILVSDMFFQYIDYHASFHDILRNFDFTKILYSWNMGLGGSFVGLVAYYLSSPFTLLTLLFPKENLPESLLLITLLKVGSCGFAFNILLKQINYKVDLFNIIFSACYALSSFIIVYSYNIMWLDSVILLPLLIVCLDKLISENKFRLFTILLFILFISNFYMSYMVGAFCFIYFILRILLSEEVYPMKVVLKKVILFFASTSIAIGGAAFLILPTIFNISSMAIEENLSIEFGLSDWIYNFPGKFFIGAYDSVTDSLSPNIYSGLLPLLFGIVYFISKNNSLKEKFMYAILIVIIFISFYIQPLNLIWHAFDYPNWFPNRFSFIFSFIMLIISYKGLRHSTKSNGELTVSFLILIIALVISIFYYHNSNYDNKISLTNFQIITTIILVGLYYLNISLVKLKRYNFCYIFLVMAVTFELFSNTFLLMKGTETQQPYYGRGWYKDLFIKEDLINHVKSTDDSFYRIESDGARTSNDSLSLNYNTFSHFSSLSNQKMNRFLNRMFYYDDAFLLLKKYGDGRSTQVIDSVFGIKYIISPFSRGEGYSLIKNENGFNLYENINSLSLAFVSNKSIKNLHLNNDNPFTNQEKFINSLTGNNEQKLFYRADIQNKQLENIIYVGNEEDVRVNPDSEFSKIKFQLKVNKKGPTYLYFNANAYYSVYVNDTLVPGYLNDTIYLGDYEEEDIINISIQYHNILQDVFNYFPIIEVYTLDNLLFSSLIHDLKNNQVMNLKVDNNIISGEFNLKEDSTIFTTIPFDKSWKLYCNGNEIEYFPVDDAFLAFDLNSGVCDISLIYIPKGLILGMIITLSIVIGGITCYIIKRRQRE